MATSTTAKIEWLEDNTGVPIAPYTTLKAVLSESGSTLQGLIADYDTISSKTESQLKEYIASGQAVKKIVNVVSNKVLATCNSDGDSSEKSVTITGLSDFILEAGARIIVNFTETNTASNCTLNVNSSGAKQIQYDSSVYTGSADYICGKANHYIEYIYNGNYWVWMGHSSDVNTTYELATTSSDGLMSAADKSKLDNLDTTMSTAISTAIQDQWEVVGIVEET